MIKKLSLYYRTLKHLKPIQIRYRLWYILRSRWRRFTGFSYPQSVEKSGRLLSFKPFIDRPESYREGEFTFLNLSHSFTDSIDWNYLRHGKLWAYNLNYFDYLHQPFMTKDMGLKLINDFIDQAERNREGMEPYPISLRGSNWIKFLIKYEVADKKIDSALYAQYLILFDNLEYHLLGNHLLENGFSLLIGGIYFNDQKLLQKGEGIVTRQLEEQILDDGGHFERSPMYHAILLERLLDCLNLSQKNPQFGLPHNTYLQTKSSEMLSWLREITFDNGNWPMVNDSAWGIAASTREIQDYAERLGNEPQETELSESGYRRFKVNGLEICMDVGDIGPDYIPGHAHSDTLSFVIHHKGTPIIVDPGVSTYEANERRKLERSTEMHNTVMVEGREQSGVWSAFRVGKRAYAEILEESDHYLKATHSGYKELGVRHVRSWTPDNKTVTITDEIIGKNVRSIAYLHFHPDLSVTKQGTNVLKAGDLKIRFDGAEAVELKPYKYAQGFNHCKEAVKAQILFKGKLNSMIIL